MARPVDGYLRYRERIVLSIRIQHRQSADSIDQRVPPRTGELDCKKSCDQQALGPVQQPGGHPMMLSNRQPLEVRLRLIANVGQRVVAEATQRGTLMLHVIVHRTSRTLVASFASSSRSQLVGRRGLASKDPGCWLTRDFVDQPCKIQPGFDSWRATLTCDFLHISRFLCLTTQSDAHAVP